MMQIKIAAVGKLKETYWQEAQKEYLKRLSRYATLQVTEVAEERLSDSDSSALAEQGKIKEGARLLQACQKGGIVIALTLNGDMPDSLAFAARLRNWTLSGISSFTFLIGGSTGLSDEVQEAADFKMSLSKLTFPHQMARIVLLEQLYRTFKIIGNETYHK